MNLAEKWDWPMTVEIDHESFPQDKYRSVVETILNVNGEDNLMYAWPSLALFECMDMVDCVGDLSGCEKKEELLQLLRRVKTITIKYDANIIHEKVLSLQQALSSSSATMTFCIKEDQVLVNMWTFAPWVLAKMYYLSTIQLQALVNRLSMPGQASWKWSFGISHEFGHCHVSDVGKMEDNKCKKSMCTNKLRQCYGSVQPDNVTFEINWNSLTVLQNVAKVIEAIMNMKTLVMSLVNAHERRWLSFQPMCSHIIITHGPSQNITIDGSSIHITDDFKSSNHLSDLIEEHIFTQSIEDASLATVYNYTNKINDYTMKLELMVCNFVFILNLN